ncbi:MAG TPA: hypothetical protein VHQ47_07180 [Phycisphaerae bacterium]|jgi:hypothetical protein|nr:hypothetical protein [Phycisphaerae bacterium]
MARGLIAVGLAIAAAGSACTSTSSERAVHAALDAMAQGDDQRAVKDFSRDLLKAHDAKNLALVWENLEKQAGDFGGRGGSSWHVIEGRRYLFTRMSFARGAFVALDACDAQGKINFFEWGPVSDAAEKIASAKPVTESGGIRQLPMTVPSAWGPLPATLTLPPGKGPFPAVLLVAGAGRNDEDETIGPNKPFRDLALGLSR